MTMIRSIGPVLGSALIAWVCASPSSAQVPRPNALPTTLGAPSAFGINSYTVTTISATSFTGRTSSMSYATSPSLGRYGGVDQLLDYYVGLDLPAGAVIDYIGLNTTTDTAFVIGVELLRRDRFGNLSPVGNLDSTIHDWDTDINASPIGYLWHGRTGEALILHVQNGPNPNFQFFGWVEVWWKRSVGPVVGGPTFNDVPSGHPFYQYIEALAASGITGGCGTGIYCPNNNVTRGQMAVFLAKALGLHWPAN